MTYACGRGMGSFVLRTSNFLFCKKKVTKENHSNLRFKDPLARGGFRRCGGELAFPWRGGGLRRPHFFLRRKKCGKESRLDLRSKGPLARGGFRRLGGEQVLRLRARDGEFRAPARVTFFFCKKKVTKENHLDLRSKDPLAHYGAYKFSGAYSRIECSG